MSRSDDIIAVFTISMTTSLALCLKDGLPLWMGIASGLLVSTSVIGLFTVLFLIQKRISDYARRTRERRRDPWRLD